MTYFYQFEGNKDFVTFSLGAEDVRELSLA